MKENIESDLIVPVVLWNSEAPKHRISQIIAIQNGDILVTGSLDGQIIQWKIGGNGIQPSMMLLGHDTAITCLAPVSSLPTSTRFISSCRKGRLCLWESRDGSCIESVKHPFVHRRIIPYTFQISSTQSASQLYCIGDYADIVVVDANDLNILFTLNSRVEPDWINALTVVKRQNLHDAIIGISISGMIKIWSLSDIVKADHSCIYEDESKFLSIKNVQTISCSFLNSKILLLISSSSWQILDINNLNPLIVSECAIDAVDGAIISEDKIAIGFIDGTIALFQLPKHRLSGSSNPSNSDHPFVFGLLKSFESSLNSSVNYFFDFRAIIKNNAQIFAYRADDKGNITTLKIPENLDSFVNEVLQIKKPVLLNPTLQQSLAKVWGSNKQNLPGTFNTENKKITATQYISNQGKLLLGCDDGKIIMTNACEAIKSQLIDSATSVQHRILAGHSAAVTCFLYPFEESQRYDPVIFISGGKDFCVICWNLTTGTKLHSFSSQGGVIQRFLIPPENCNIRILNTICSVADDNSVALLSLKENKCILLASRQIFPIIDIHWRPLDDLLMIQCSDDSLYVWQMETANLDRIVTGLIAEEVIEGCKEQIGIFEYSDEAGANQATQMLRAIKNKNLAAVKKIAGKNDSNTQVKEGKQRHTSKPLSIIELKNFSNQAHLLLFNVNGILENLHMDVNVPSKPEMRSTSGQQSLSTLIGSKTSKSPKILRSQTSVTSNPITNTAKLLSSLIDSNKAITTKSNSTKYTVPIHFGTVTCHGIMSLYMPSNNKLEENVINCNNLITTHSIANVAITNAMAYPSIVEGSILAENLHLKIEQLAEKWQDSCNEIRKASQALLLQELTRAGMNGRKQIINNWAPFLPVLLDSSLSILGKIPSNNISLAATLNSNLENHPVRETPPPAATVTPAPPTSKQPPSRPPPPIPPRKRESIKSVTEQQQLPPPKPIQQQLPSAIPDSQDSESYLKPIQGGINQIRRNQFTATILLGVLAAKFPNEFENDNALRGTALSLFEILIAPESSLLPINSPLRRSAIDLIGRGFALWQPHLDLSKVLLALLDLTSLDHSPETTQIAKTSLSLIASACPKAVLITLSTEVARYHSLQQTTQTVFVSALKQSSSTVLRIIDQLIESHYNDVVDLIVPVCDILIHCLDFHQLKQQNLYELFPPIAKLYMVAYSTTSKKLGIGGSNGAIVIHELKSTKSQTIQAHNSRITSLAFSPDEKFLAVYAAGDAKITIWQTHQSFLGMGQSQMKLIKSLTAPIEASQLPQSRLVWVGPKLLKLFLSNGTDSIIQL